MDQERTGEVRETTLRIVLPERSDDAVSEGLRRITRALHEAGLVDASGYGLGGQFSYAAHYENDVFMLRPYCWCDSDKCPWCSGCDCPDECWESQESATGWRKKARATCDYRTGAGMFARFAWKDGGPFHRDDLKFYNPPLFWHKPSDSRANWYKWIGRSMATVLYEDWQRIEQDCLRSIRSVPSHGR